MIKAIIFDYGGVLSTEPTLRTFSKIYASKHRADSDKFTQVLLDTWFQARINKIKSELFWKRLADFLKVDKKILRRDFMNFYEFRQEVLDLIKKLKKQHYKIGLLSNQIEDWLEENIKKYNLNKFFDVIVTSYNSGVAKPEIAIYKKVLKELNMTSTECIFIDDIKENLEPAKKLGMKIILFQNTKQLIKDLRKLGVEV